MGASVLQVRLDDELKEHATAIYDALGMDLSTAVRIFLKRSVLVNGLPFDMTLPKPSHRGSAGIEDVSNMTLDEINAVIEIAREKIQRMELWEAQQVKMDGEGCQHDEERTGLPGKG